MNQKIAQEAFELAEKELKEKQIDSLKETIKQTLIRIEEVEKEIKELQDEKKILKLDIDDLKEGRLDRIEERQKKDEKAKKVSLIKIVRETTVVNNFYDYWHVPYTVTYYPAATTIPSFGNTVYCTTTSSSCSGSYTLDGSTAKNYSIGTYTIGDKVVHLR